MAGLSLQDLADKLKNRVTRQALHKYEKGEFMPDSEMLGLLCDALGVLPDYFYRKTEVKMGEISFRKRQSFRNTAGDTRTAGSPTQSRGYEFGVMDDCVILGNSGTKHSTADFLCNVVATGGTRSAYNSGILESGSTMFGVYGIPIVARASLPAAGAAQDGLIIMDDNGTDDVNRMLYARGERFRIDGGADV